MQTAGNLIAAAAEFPAGMEDGKYHLQCGHPFLFIDIHGNPTTIIHNGNGVVRVDLYCDFVAKAGKGFIALSKCFEAQKEAGLL